MLLHATRPFFAPPELEPAVRLACTALAIVRFARESQVLAYGGPLGLTRDALDALVSSGILQSGVFHPSPAATSAESYVALGIKGARLLAEATGLAVRGMAPAAMRRGSQKRAHDVEVGDVCLSILSLSREGRIKLLGIEADPKKVPVCLGARAKRFGAERVAVQPDAYVLAAGPHGPSALLVELDRGTIGIRRMAEKYRSYLAWRESGGPDRDLSLRAVRVLTIAPTERRALALHTAALSANDGRQSGFLLFATQDMLAPSGGVPIPSARPLGAPPDRAVSLFPDQARP